jgi:hypothetical protein
MQTFRPPAINPLDVGLAHRIATQPGSPAIQGGNAANPKLRSLVMAAKSASASSAPRQGSGPPHHYGRPDATDTGIPLCLC